MIGDYKAPTAYFYVHLTEKKTGDVSVVRFEKKEDAFEWANHMKKYDSVDKYTVTDFYGNEVERV